MPPHFLFHPVFDQAKALVGVSHGKVAPPSPQDRVHQLYHPSHRLGLVAPEYLLQLAQKRRPLLPHRRVPRTPDPFSALDAPNVKTQEAKGFPAGQIDRPTLLLIDGDLQGHQFLAESSLDRLQQPIMAMMSLHYNPHVVGKTRLLDIRVCAAPGDLLCALQHPVHLCEGQMTEQGGDHASLGDALATRRLQDAL